MSLLALVSALLLLAPLPPQEAPAGPAPVLVVGAPSEGPMASLRDELFRRKKRSMETDVLPERIPWQVEVVLIGRRPRSPREEEAWEASLGRFVAVGGRVGAPSLDDKSGIPPLPDDAVLGRIVEVADVGAVAAAADLLAVTRLALRHPADGPAPGVNPELYRLPLPDPPRGLPVSALLFLAVVTAGLLGTVAFARLRQIAALRSGVLVAVMGAAGAGLLPLTGTLPEDVVVTRFHVEEHGSLMAPTGRRIEFLLVERRAGSGVAEGVLETDV
ncbi:MAG: hypothetical protein ACYTG4_00525, partial [Planctomycetota bacterium]